MSGSKIPDISPFLSDVKSWEDNISGGCLIRGCRGVVGDYTVSVNNDKILLCGSLSKNYYGDNLHTFVRGDVQRAIEQLSDYLHIDVNQMRVWRLDVSTVIHTKYAPADYYPYLGQKPHFRRESCADSTLYYKTKQRRLIFYDKTEWAAAKGVAVPEIMQDSNLLRYEVQYNKHVDRQLKTAVTGATLYDRGFYRSVVQGWYEEFKAIEKLREQKFMIDGTPKDVMTAILANGLQAAGGQDYIEKCITELKGQNYFSNRSNYTKIKTGLIKILSVPRGCKSDMVKELESAIFDVARYAR
jgi:hypothetical protein